MRFFVNFIINNVDRLMYVFTNIEHAKTKRQLQGRTSLFKQKFFLNVTQTYIYIL